MANDPHLRALLSPKIEKGLRKVVASLKKHKVPFALIGGLAFDHYAKEPRFTRDIDFVVSPENWEKAVFAIRKAGFVYGSEDEYLTQLENNDHVRVDLLFGVGDPEESARELATVQTVLGVRVPVAPPELLVWMYLLSDQRKHAEDAEALVRRGISLIRLASWLKQTGSREELTYLARIVAKVRGQREKR